MNSRKYIEIAISLFSSEKNNTEEVLIELKKNGANIIDTMRALTIGLKFSIKDADNIILNSKTWATKKDDSFDLRNKFLK